MQRFQTLLDRYGADLAQWPARDAEQARRVLLLSEEARREFERVAGLERLIASTRPVVSPSSVRRVVDGAAAAIRQRAERLSPIDRFRILLAAPVPRVAFVMGLTAIGFVLGTVFGAAEIGAAEGSAGPVLTASADDGLF